MSTTTALPPVQACCGKRHPLPFQHRRYYVDKRGRSKYTQECNRCFRSLEERGLRPSNIRWCEKNSDMCLDCRIAIKDAVGAEERALVAAGATLDDIALRRKLLAAEVFGAVAANNPVQAALWPRKEL